MSLIESNEALQNYRVKVDSAILDASLVLSIGSWNLKNLTLCFREASEFISSSRILFTLVFVSPRIISIQFAVVGVFRAL